MIADDQLFLHRGEVLFVLFGDRFVEHVRLVGLLLEQWSVVQHATQVRQPRLVVDLVAQHRLMHLLLDIEICRGAPTSDLFALRVEKLRLADADMVKALVARCDANESLRLLEVLHSLLADFQLLAHILGSRPVHVSW